MPYSTNSLIPAHVWQQYDSAFSAAVQQEDSRFAQVAHVDPAWKADIYTKTQRSVVDWFVNNARFGARAAREFVAGKRSGVIQRLSMEAVKFDRNDTERVGHMADPKGTVIQDGVMGLNRIRDKLFIAASTASALGGPNHPHLDTIAFPSGNIVPINFTKQGQSTGSNVGMTIHKIRRARTQLELTGLDLSREELVLAMGPEQREEYVLLAEAAPNEAWAKQALDWESKYLGGDKSAKLHGFQVVITNDLPVVNSVRTCVVFAKRAFCWRPMGALDNRIDPGSAENNHAVTVTAYADFGVFREIDELVIQLPCVA